VLDKSNGRVLMDPNGNFFYSPNCSRVVPIPQIVPDSEMKNPFYPERPKGRRPDSRTNFWDLDASSYRNPQWWTLEFGWISFLQISEAQLHDTLFDHLKFSTLQAIPNPNTGEVEGYILAPWERDNWLRLDVQLRKACIALERHYRMQPVHPVSPWSMGYLRPHMSYGIVMTSLRKSREWFPIWMAMLSYLLAGSQTRERQLMEYPSLARIHWKELLLVECASEGIDHRWVDLLSQSAVAYFSADVPRAGVFLHLPTSDGNQPDPLWFCEFGVPLWYPWNKQVDQYHKHLAPLPYQLQEAATFLTKSPSTSVLPPRMAIPNPNVAPSPPPDVAVPFPSPPLPLPVPPRPLPCTKEMDEFFKLREERNARKLATETEQDRQRRLSRESNPPLVSARMFLWVENSRGEYEREEIPRKRREDHFELYGNDQIKYDSIQNEYHICELWGDYPKEEEEDFFYEGDMRDGDDLPEVEKGDTVVDLIEQDHWTDNTITICGDSSSLPDRFEGEILNVLSLFLGYTPLLPLPSVKELQGEAARKSFCRSFGIGWAEVQNIQSVFERPSLSAAVDFFRRLAQKNGSIMDDEWDLMARNVRGVMFTERFKQFRHVQAKDGTHLYMLDLKERRSTKWFLALKRASDVAVVCRLHVNLKEYDIVEFLLTHGIPFHTLCPSNHVGTPNAVRVRPQPCLDLPTRQEGYEFNGSDYLAYRERCIAIIKHPRGRAVLMRGHYMWRLAMNVVPWEAVHNGPSGWSPAEEMIVVEDSVTGMELVDDKLSEREQDALCGTYQCYTGTVFFFYAKFCSHRWFTARQWGSNSS